MPDFQFASKTATGQAKSGVLTGTDAADIVRQLAAKGETATKVTEIRSKLKKSQKVNKIPKKGSMTKAELGSFIRELATALDAGLPLMQSLATIRKQSKKPSMIAILNHLIEKVEAGDPLYKACATWGKPFDNMIIGMLRAADASGKMTDVLDQLADLLDRSLALRRELVSATIYPMIVAGLVGLSVVILVTFLVPTLIEPIAGNMVLPWPTQVVLNSADFIQTKWWLMIGIILLLFFSWRSWISSASNKLLFDRTILKIPILGVLVRDVAVARFTRTLGTLASSGLPILEALRITRDTLGNEALAKAVDAVGDQVTGGKALAEPMDKSGLFPPLLIQVVNLGEKSGRLEQMLLHAANSFDRQVDASLKIFSKALPPILLMVMAIIAGFVLSAILLPILSLQDMVGAA